MPLVKSYRRYEPAHTAGLVCAAAGQAVWVGPDSVAVPALAAVHVLHARTAERTAVLGDPFGATAVTALALHPGGSVLAAGYEDGAIVLWTLATGEQQVAFQGHRGAVHVLRFLEDGARLVSGSADTDLIVWDVVNETGLFRLRGHKGAVTDCCFLGDNLLLSGGHQRITNETKRKEKKKRKEKEKKKEKEKEKKKDYYEFDARRLSPSLSSPTLVHVLVHTHNTTSPHRMGQ